ncbi:C1 family peptidase [Armatimonas sp.]|uniref:C1 family peptidase n=1 Tax=Armatimonas sp. TaxID=1872638 RepID=UPI00286B3182|nr:C1 family peptidase [Armatimonas sp.]
MKFDVDLRPEVAKLRMMARSQGSRGTCSVFAMTFCIEFLLRKKRKLSEPLSVEFLNWAKNTATGQKKDGDFFDRIAAGFERYGMAGESALPYAPRYNAELTPEPPLLEKAKQTPRLKGHFIKPWSTQEVITDRQVGEMKAILRRGIPVAIGLRWPKGGKGKDVSIEGLSVMDYIPASDVFDGHSLALVGYSDEGKLWVFANWAGPSWGDKGFGYMSDAYLRPYINDAYVYE